MHKAGKIWGTTQLVENTPSFEFHRIEFKANSCCSEHYHETKWNGFFVESGRLLIKTWSGDGLIDNTTLKAGEYFKVRPGVWHQFIGIDEGVAFELYWAEFNGEDIVRRTQGQIFDKDADEHVSHPLTDLNYDGQDT